MNHDATFPRAPRSILLATDLSSHCDRALDRATRLARRWSATLHVVHALPPSAQAGAWWAADGGHRLRGRSRIELVERQIRRDMRGEPVDCEIHVDEGEAADVILRTAAQEDCELIIVGTSGPAFASIIAQTTTETLLRRARSSVLVVKTRPRDDYRQLLVGTDFTGESRHGLETAAAWFADAHFTLMHALDIPYRSMFLKEGRADAFARLEHETMESFAAGAHLPDAVRGHLATRIAYGYPEAMLSEHVRANDVDLTVIGALARGIVFHVLVGGNASRIVQSVPSDVLMVRDKVADRSAAPTT